MGITHLHTGCRQVRYYKEILCSNLICGELIESPGVITGVKTRGKKRKEDSDAKLTAVITPDKKKGKKCVTLFVLTTGKHAMFQSTAIADRYASENGDAIVATHTFPSLAACQKFKTEFTQKPKQEKTNNHSHASLEDQAAIERINRRRIANAPSKTLMFLYKTSSFSTACIFFMRVLDQSGAPQWYYKQKDHTHTLKAYAEDVSTKINGNQTMAMIQNMDYTERRDLEKGENIIMKTKGYVQYEQFSHFIIPVTDFKNEEQEKAYIEETLTFFGNEMKRIMTTTLYLGALRECTQSYAPTLVKHLFGEVPGIPFRQFIHDCRVVVRPLREYTDVIIKDRVFFVRNILLENDNSKPKYETITDDDLHRAFDSDDENEPDSNNNNNDDNDSAPNSASYSPDFNPGQQSSVAENTDIQTANL